MNLSQMLDLPREERSRYLAAIPLTREYAFGCLDQCHIQHVRRVVTRNGGTWREEYHPPGVAVVATFRTPAGMRACTLDLIRWQNKQTRENDPHSPYLSELLLDETFARFSSIPALEFKTVNSIHPGPVKIKRPSHPIRG